MSAPLWHVWLHPCLLLFTYTQHRPGGPKGALWQRRRTSSLSQSTLWASGPVHPYTVSGYCRQITPPSTTVKSSMAKKYVHFKMDIFDAQTIHHCLMYGWIPARCRDALYVWVHWTSASNLTPVAETGITPYKIVGHFFGLSKTCPRIIRSKIVFYNQLFIHHGYMALGSRSLSVTAMLNKADTSIHGLAEDDTATLNHTYRPSTYCQQCTLYASSL